MTYRINNAPASELVRLLPADLIWIERLLGSTKSGSPKLGYEFTIRGNLLNRFESPCKPDPIAENKALHCQYLQKRPIHSLCPAQKRFPLRGDEYYGLMEKRDGGFDG